MEQVQRQAVPSELDKSIRAFERRGFSCQSLSREGQTYAARLENQAGVPRFIVCRLNETGNGGECVAYF